ncbi:hypothetical protein SCI_1312 [Streptococcus constellatus subsp. pharyngis C1050]|nr:hypothetical protein SCRE_1269 [Streptococcus constellatus subsp. pharyngis C232]AGU74847.1 hypothetical protein SCR2_1269 [Streptococcus constellatus subsp. pharyngis C818]AGU80237.1 hypothetical protein SCI_1312 [Streptococcus constellatus subsp. pharyngis C1050]
MLWFFSYSFFFFHKSSFPLLDKEKTVNLFRFTVYKR